MTAIRLFLDDNIKALRDLRERIDNSILEAAATISRCEGKIVFTGLGKSGHVARLLASAYCSYSLPSIYLHPTEALHGDLGVLDQRDIVVGISNSGQTQEVLEVIRFAKSMDLQTIGITGTPGTLSEVVDVFLNASVGCEAGHLRCAPTSSLAVAMSIGQSIAFAVAKAKCVSTDDFEKLHPAGALGRKTNGVTPSRFT
jgi:arabinose-5-phosphate isomerase